MSPGLFFPFYIIEVEMKAQSARIIYRAEDGYGYERQHGSTVNLDFLENLPVTSSIRCHRCGETGHKATNCKSGNNKKVSCPVIRWRSILALLTLQSNAAEVRCYECEEIGHSVRFCPNL